MDGRRPMVIAALLVVALLAPACGDDEGTAASARASSAANGPPHALSPPQGTAPRLSSAHEATAKELALAEPRVRRLMALSPGSAVSEIGGWWTLGNRSLLGASVLIRFDPPLTGVDERWTLIQYDKTEQSSPPYFTAESTFLVTSLPSIEVRVEFNPGRVVGLQPGPESDTKRPDSPSSPGDD